jgi:hypothetical protein
LLSSSEILSQNTGWSEFTGRDVRRDSLLDIAARHRSGASDVGLRGDGLSVGGAGGDGQSG